MVHAKRYVLGVALAAALGFAFAAVSTSDFVQHLDRQVHSVHCSFVPGLGDDARGTSGCHATMMSPYSSIFRQSMWGGLPISLPAMSVFAFIAAWALLILMRKKDTSQPFVMVLLMATLIPVAASLVMGVIAWRSVEAACKLCIGIYVSSTLSFIFALCAFRETRVQVPIRAGANEATMGKTVAPADDARGAWVLALVLIAVFVAIPAVAYAFASPDHSSYIGRCGQLESSQGLDQIAVPMRGGDIRGVDTLEVFDPLCPACRAFEERLEKSSVIGSIRRRLVLFPLDNSCNWMVDAAVHPGACVISEAVLCAKDDAALVVAWAFKNQETIRETTAKDPDAAQRMVKAEFPSLASCLGSSAVKSKLNRSLRWAVANHLPVLTPQFYVGNKKLCDEDTDLGLEYALSRLVESGGNR